MYTLVSLAKIARLRSSVSAALRRERPHEREDVYFAGLREGVNEGICSRCCSGWLLLLLLLLLSIG